MGKIEGPGGYQMPNWLKVMVGVISSLFITGVVAWASSIKTDTAALVLQGADRDTRLTKLEEHEKAYREDVREIQELTKHIDSRLNRVDVTLGKIEEKLK